jgi:hypothetical protein
MNEDEVQKAYTIVMKALEDVDFQRWLNTPAIMDNLGFDYDQYSTGNLDNFEEPLNYKIWALGKYLGRKGQLGIDEGIKVLVLKDGKDV